MVPLLFCLLLVYAAIMVAALTLKLGWLVLRLAASGLDDPLGAARGLLLMLELGLVGLIVYVVL